MSDALEKSAGGGMKRMLEKISNNRLSFVSMELRSVENSEKIIENEAVIDFTNGALTKFLIKLSSHASESDEKQIGAYFHVLNDLERIADHLMNVGYSIVSPIGSEKEEYKL